MTATSSMTRARLLCGTALLLATAGGAIAEDTQILSLDPILVREEDPAGADADRATAIYAAEAELERARMGDVRDVFAGMSAVSVGGAIPLAQKIFVNGVDMLNLSMTVDGTAQNNRTFHHTTATTFDPGVVRYVRVDPGVATADAGPNALAGSVVIETIHAGEYLEDDQTFGGEVRLSYGDNGETFGRSVILAGQSNGFEILGYAKSATGSDYEDGAGNTVGGTAADLQSYLLKLAYESEDGHRIELSGQKIRDDGLRPEKANFGATIPASRTPLLRYDTTRRNLSLRYVNTQAGEYWDPEVVVGYSDAEVLVPLPYNADGHSETFSVKAQNTFHLNSDSNIVVGVDHYNRKSDYTLPNGRPYFGLVLSESAKNTGAFVQARIQVNNDLKLSAGARYDSVDFEGVSVPGRIPEFNKTYSGASGNLSATYQATDALSLRAGYSSVFGGVQLEDNYNYTENARAPWNYAGLRASRARNAVIGFDWDAGHFTFGGEVFQTKIDNARRRATLFDFESKGFNLAGTYDWDSGFLRASYSDNEIKVNGSDQSSYLARDFGTPIGRTLALEVQQELSQWNMLVGGRVDVALEETVAKTGGNTKLDGYEVVSVFAEYTPVSYDNITLRASVENLFDVNYSDRATYGNDAPNDIVTLREPGRTISFEAVARF